MWIFWLPKQNNLPQDCCRKKAKNVDQEDWAAEMKSRGFWWLSHRTKPKETSGWVRVCQRELQVFIGIYWYASSWVSRGKGAALGRYGNIAKALYRKLSKKQGHYSYSCLVICMICLVRIFIKPHPSPWINPSLEKEIECSWRGEWARVSSLLHCSLYRNRSKTWHGLAQCHQYCHRILQLVLCSRRLFYK